MKVPLYRYFNPDRPEDKPPDPGMFQFWKWEKMFWQHAQRYGAERLAEGFWNGRVRGGYFDKLTAEPEEDRAMAMWMASQCGKWCPYDEFDVEAYFAKPRKAAD